MTTGEARGSHLELLHHISRIVSSHLGLEEILQELIGLTVEVTHCDACLVYLTDRGANELVLRASQLPHDAEIGHIRMKLGEGVTGWVALHKSVVALSSNAAADNRFKAFPALSEDTFEAFLSVPLVSGGDLIGVLNVHHRRPHAHTPEQVSLVSFVGEQMGGVIAKSRLAEQSRRALQRIEALAAMGDAISEEASPEQILDAIARMVEDTLDLPGCSLALAGEAPAASAGARVPLGAIDLYTREARVFSGDEMGFLRAVARQAGLALENVRLTRTLQERKLVERAKGILQHKHNLTEEEAYLRLRNESRRLRRPMRELAEAVIVADELSRNAG